MKAVPKADLARIIDALEQVANNLTMRMNFVTEMVGEPGVWRLRKGDWRATCVIDGAEMVVTRVGNRREMYR
jgi:mRNA-degrading endonuclease RelE of RelBE toxin-antitoxin system